MKYRRSVSPLSVKTSKMIAPAFLAAAPAMVLKIRRSNPFVAGCGEDAEAARRWSPGIGPRKKNSMMGACRSESLASRDADGEAQATGESPASLSLKKKRGKQICPGLPPSIVDGKTHATGGASAFICRNKMCSQIPVVQAVKRPSSCGSPSSKADGKAQSTGKASATLSRRKKISNTIPLVRAGNCPVSPGLQTSSKADGEAQTTGKASAALSRKKKISNSIPLVRAGKCPVSPGLQTSKADGKARPTGEISAPSYSKKKMSNLTPLVRSAKRPSSPVSLPNNADSRVQLAGKAPALSRRETRSKLVVNKGRYSKDGRCSLTPRGVLTEESALMQEKKPHIPGPAIKEKVLIDHKQEQAGQMQDVLDLDNWTITKQATEYLWRLPIGAAPGDEVFWDYCDDEQLAKLYQRLALYRLKDRMLLSEGKEVDIAELKERYPLSRLQDQGYFEYLEASLEWYPHPEHTNIAGLDDYQRLALRNDGHYGNWGSYSLTYHTYQADLDYVRYYEEMSKEIKWIEDKVGVDDKQWRTYEKRACFQAMKIGSGYKNLYRHSVLTAFMDYMDSVQFDFDRRRDFDRIYLQIWKRVAKDKIDYERALKEIYEQNMFPSRMRQIKLEVEKLPPSFHGWMKKKYDTYVACIDEKISEEDCHLLIIGSMKEMFPEHKTYLDYVKKKIEVAARIGLIPKDVDVTTQGREGNGILSLRRT